MEPEERQEVTQLLEFGEHTAAGRMTTEFIAVAETAVVDDAIEALKTFEGSREALATIYLTGPGHRLVGAVPLVTIAISSPAVQLSELSEPYHRLRPRHAGGRGGGAVRQVQPADARGRRRARADRRHHHGRRRDRDAAGIAAEPIADDPFVEKAAVAPAVVVAVVGPGFIAGDGGNDAGGIWTYSVAGAQFGYSLLWAMIPTTIALVVVQEMAARMGAVTGKGLSDLIREEFGFRITFFLMIALVVTNFGNVMAEFAGVASSLELFGVSRYIVVPLAAAAVWMLVVQGTYGSVEKIFLVASAFYVCYIVAGLLAHPDWLAAARATFAPPEANGIRNYGYLYMLIGLVGTTIAPWMQFYLQASVVEKGVTVRQYRASRWDVIIGSVFAAIVAWFIIVACAATLHRTGAPPSRARLTRRRRCGRWLASTPTCCLPPGCSTHRCSRRPCCRSPPLIPSARASASNQDSTRSSTRRRRSTGFTRCSSSPAPACCSSRTSRWRT